MKKLLFAAAVMMAAVVSCNKPGNQGGDTPSAVSKIEFAQKSYSVVAGETVALKLVATPENASLAGVEFSSNHENYATVDKDGVVTGVAAGTVTITAKLGTLKATTKVKVESAPVPATGIKVDQESVTVKVGRTVTVAASLLPENTTEQLNATWTSANEQIATVNGGVITGVAEGTTTVTATQGTFTATVNVTVEAGAAGQGDIKFYQGYGTEEVESITLAAGRTTEVYVQLEGQEGDVTFEWSSSNKEVMTVAVSSWYTAMATLTAVAPGKAVITVTAGDKSGALEVTVTEGIKLNKREDWTITPGRVKAFDTYGDEVEGPGATLSVCSAPFHSFGVDLLDQGEELNVAALMNQLITYVENAKQYGEQYLSYFLSTEVPETAAISYGEGKAYAVVFGFDAEYNCTGDYNVVYFNTADYPAGGGDDPGDDPQPGVEGKIVSLDGEFFAVDWDTDMDAVQEEVTMEAWVNAASLTGGKDGIRTIMGAEGMFLLRFESTKLHLVYAGAPRTDKPSEYKEENIACDTAFETDKWYHVAATYVAGGAVKLYVNGEKVAEGEAADHDINLNGVEASYELPFKFFVGVSANLRTFKGSLAYLRVWDIALSQDEIKANMKVADPDDEGSNLLASWKFNEGTGNTVKDYGAMSDYSGNGGYTLTAVSTKEQTAANLTWIDGSLPF